MLCVTEAEEAIMKNGKKLAAQHIRCDFID